MTSRGRSIRAYFGEHGIAVERIELVGATPLDEQLAAIAEVDIGLDTFPYTGSTTTLDPKRSFGIAAGNPRPMC